MADQFLHAPWNDIYVFFTKGHPPLALQILLLNTVVLALFMARRMRGARAVRSETSIAIQCFLIFANALIMFRDYFPSIRHWLPYS